MCQVWCLIWDFSATGPLQIKMDQHGSYAQVLHGDVDSPCLTYPSRVNQV